MAELPAESDQKGKGVVWLNAWRDPVANIKAFNAHIFIFHKQILFLNYYYLNKNMHHKSPHHLCTHSSHLHHIHVVIKGLITILSPYHLTK